ncbi:caspase family protein [Kinneretia aquatilis]|uniref:caspase family protein n=1 Tax=Kinneretia aquatilis TaxID=2070761 RepID=UPI0010572EF9|nr:caspase family protein [Paucibacter aquatile]
MRPALDACSPRHSRRHCLLTLAALGWAPAQVGAAPTARLPGMDRALLIGVSRYPALPARLWLHGPDNDVALMQELLRSQGLEAGRIQALSGAPSRTDILQAMEDLAQQARAGERLLFYYSGHGSQQPQAGEARWPEADGLDEVLLPADVQSWSGEGASGQIPNALLDDEIGTWIDRLVDRGAQVWAVFDTCHAAGMARSEPGEPSPGPRVRALHPAELGLTLSHARSSAADAKATRAPGRFGSPRSDGRTLLFAGRSHERVREEWMPKGGSLANTRLHGVFTWHLAQLLRQQGWLDGERLIEQVRQRFLAEQRLSPVPMLLGQRR